VPLDAVDVEVDDPLAGVLHPRREALRHFQQRFLGGPFALAVAGAGDQLGAEGPGLGQGEPRPHAGGPGQAGGGHHPGGVAVALHDHEGLADQLRLAAQPGGEGEERQEEAGDAGRCHA
jgi:hypothetical protein